MSLLLHLSLPVHPFPLPLNLYFLLHQKQIDALTDERDALQIELSEAAANLTAAGRKFQTLKQRYTTLAEEYTQLQNDHAREIKMVFLPFHLIFPASAFRLSRLNCMEMSEKADTEPPREPSHSPSLVSILIPFV